MVKVTAVIVAFAHDEVDAKLFHETLRTSTALTAEAAGIVAGSCDIRRTPVLLSRGSATEGPAESRAN